MITIGIYHNKKYSVLVNAKTGTEISERVTGLTGQALDVTLKLMKRELERKQMMRLGISFYRVVGVVVDDEVTARETKETIKGDSLEKMAATAERILLTVR